MAVNLKSKFTKQTNLSPLANKTDLVAYSQVYVEWLESRVQDNDPVILQVKSLVSSPNFRGLSITMKSKK